MTDKEHPAAKPAPMPPPPHAASHAAAPLTGEDFKTEQEKDGMGPAAEPVESPGPAETIAQQGIGPKDPYPEGNPPVPGAPPPAAAKPAKK